jgi:hypothetical protein
MLGLLFMCVGVCKYTLMYTLCILYVDTLGYPYRFPYALNYSMSFKLHVLEIYQFSSLVK